LIDNDLNILISTQTQLIAAQTEQLAMRDEKITELTNKISELLSHTKNNSTTKTTNQNNNKGDNEKMPAKYSDGIFRQRKSGIFEYRFCINGIQVSKYGRNHQECFDKRTQLIKANHNPKSKLDMTYGQWVEHWWITYKIAHLSKSSTERSKGLIDKYILPSLSRVQLNKINHDTLQAFLNNFMDKPNSQKKIYDIVRSSLEKAMRSGKIKTNPADGLELKRYTKKKRRCLQINEQNAVYNLLKSQNTNYLKLFMFSCCTGIRIGRIQELTAADIDFDNNEIIVKAKQRLGDEETYSVPFLPELLDGLPTTGKLFNFDMRSAQEFYQRIFSKLDIKDITIHSFRHTFISMLNFIGVPLKQIQVWAGHKTFAMTADVYTHIIKNNGESPILDYLKCLKLAQKV